jgi:hypothetical protein
VLADLACAVADGAELISDFRVMADQQELFGLVASVPTAWRTLNEIGAAGERAQSRVTAAGNAARRRPWAGIEARHGAIPGVAIADKVLDGVTCIRLDATVVPCHSHKAGAEPNFKGLACPPWAARAITPASRWPGCCAPAQQAATPPRTTSRSWVGRSRRCRRSTGGG